MSPAEPDFLRKENSWFFFGFSVYVIWISAWILRDSWCIISMSIFFDAAEKWKKSKSWIEDSKAAVPHLLLLRIWRTSQFIDCLILANFWPLPSPHKFTSHPTNFCQFSILCTTKTPLENLLASLMFQGQEFFAFTMFENDQKWEDFGWIFKSFHQCNSRNISSEVGQQLKKLQGASEVAEGNSNFAPWETERVKWPQGTVEFWSLSISVSQ